MSYIPINKLRSLHDFKASFCSSQKSNFWKFFSSSSLARILGGKPASGTAKSLSHLEQKILQGDVDKLKHFASCEAINFGSTFSLFSFAVFATGCCVCCWAPFSFRFLGFERSSFMSGNLAVTCFLQIE